MEVVMSKSILDDFDKLSKKQQRAFIAWFSGGKTLVTKYDSEGHPSVCFGKYECELVNFDETWLKVYPNLGWIEVEIEETGTAIGMNGKPKYTEYNLFVTDKGLTIRDAYWKRVE